MLLTGKTIVITRPAHQAGSLAALIENLGGKPFIFPTLEILPVEDDSQVLAAVKQISQYHIAIFVSANAVNYIVELGAELGSNMFIIAIGPGTARALQERHIPVNAMPESHHSQGILMLPELQNIHGEKIAIFCGENSRQLLKNTLISRGAVVDEMICYRRRCPHINAAKALKEWQTKNVGIIISTSSENLTNLYRLLASEWLLQTPLLVISLEMLALAKQLGFQSVVVAEGASDKEICNALAGY